MLCTCRHDLMLLCCLPFSTNMLCTCRRDLMLLCCLPFSTNMLCTCRRVNCLLIWSGYARLKTHKRCMTGRCWYTNQIKHLGFIILVFPALVFAYGTLTPQRNIKVPYANTRLTAHFMCDLMSDLVIRKFKKVWSCMTPNVLTETRCH